MKVTKEVAVKLVNTMALRHALTIAAKRGISIAEAVDFIRKSIEKHVV